MYAAPTSGRAIVRSSNAVLLEQGAHVGAPSAKLHEGIERVTAATAYQDRVEESIGGGVIEHAGFLERRERIGGEHLGPFVAVIAGGIAAREDVSEAVREAIPVRYGHDRDFASHFVEDLEYASALG